MVASSSPEDLSRPLKCPRLTTPTLSCPVAAAVCEADEALFDAKTGDNNAASSWPSWGPGCAQETGSIAGGSIEVAVRVADATNLASSGDECKVASGVAFFDHMVDQLVSHGQLRISLSTRVAGELMKPHANRARELDADAEMIRLAGLSVGTALLELLASRIPAESEASATVDRWRCGKVPAQTALAAVVASMRDVCEPGQPFVTSFAAPLDETMCEVELHLPVASQAPGVEILSGATEVLLAPYGAFPRKGREFIGSYRTCHTDLFFKSLAASMGCILKVRKVRGSNAHHIVESTFKAFARCLRKALDCLCAFQPQARPAVALQMRSSKKQRATKETSISVGVNLDPAKGDSPGAILSGLSTLDSLLQELQASSGIHLEVNCKGDLYIDDHHSAEDVLITMGKVLNESLGTKAGLNRMGCATGRSAGGACVQCVMDLSNRPSFSSDLRLHALDEEMVGDLSVEMIDHCFDSLAINSAMTLHLVQKNTDDAVSARPYAGEVAIAAARAFGAALKECIAMDPRRCGKTASSKGTLST